jgi:hypothetical protein
MKIARLNGQKGGGVPTPALILLALCLVLSVCVIAADSFLRLSLVSRATSVKTSDIPPGGAAISPGAHEEWMILPHSSMDARWWVLHTEKALREGAWRVRETQLDNAPQGREVHWSSSLVWLLAALARIISVISGKPPAECVAEAALFAGPLMLVLSLLGLSVLIARRFDWRAALFFNVVFLTTVPVYLNFVAGEADHHGLVLVFAMGCVLCLIAGGSGFVRAAGKAANTGAGGHFLPVEESRAWFRLSGVLGGAALWISAATALPVIAGAGIGAFVAFFAGRSHGERKERTPRPELWTAWGVAGCVSSLFFYALEYFPSHMGWRLEVNHPLYAFAWLGGGFLLAQMLRWMEGGAKPWRSPGDLFLIVPAFAAVTAPLVLIRCWPGKFFWVSDRFLLALHEQFILEFQSLVSFVAASKSQLAWLNYALWPALALGSIAILAIRRGLSAWGRASLALVLAPALVMQCLAFWQVRWASIALGIWALVIVVAVVTAVSSEKPRQSVIWVLLAGGWIALAGALFPQLASRVVLTADFGKQALQQDAGGNVLLRDIAHRLIQSSPDRLPVVLTGPNSSTELAYHAGIRTVGTLYWENMTGLKRAARVFAVRDEKEALDALSGAGVTHIVIPSWDNFAEPYSRLLEHEGEKSTAGTAPFFKDIVAGKQCPQWLRPLCYPIPSGQGLDANSVKIFAVLPGQSRFDALLHRGIYHLEAGELDTAEALFREAGGEKPGDARVSEALSIIAGKRAAQHAVGR